MKGTATPSNLWLLFLKRGCKMAVFKINKTKDYTVMSNHHLKETEMSLKAKGLLSVMLSLPETWDYSIIGLVAICKENESAINSTLKELAISKYSKEVRSSRLSFLIILITAESTLGVG